MMRVAILWFVGGLSACAAIAAAQDPPTTGLGAFSDDQIGAILAHGPWPPAWQRDPSNRVSGAEAGRRSGTPAVFRCATVPVRPHLVLELPPTRTLLERRAAAWHWPPPQPTQYAEPLRRAAQPLVRLGRRRRQLVGTNPATAAGCGRDGLQCRACEGSTSPPTPTSPAPTGPHSVARHRASAPKLRWSTPPKRSPPTRRPLSAVERHSTRFAMRCKPVTAPPHNDIPLPRCADWPSSLAAAAAAHATPDRPSRTAHSATSAGTCADRASADRAGNTAGEQGDAGRRTDAARLLASPYNLAGPLQRRPSTYRPLAGEGSGRRIDKPREFPGALTAQRGAHWPVPA